MTAPRDPLSSHASEGRVLDRTRRVAAQVRDWVRVRPVRALPAASAVLLVLVQITYPLSAGSARDAITVAVVLLTVATALLHAVTTRGARWAAGFFVIVSGLGLLAEMIGTATGYPFGTYSYAVDRLGPALADVPLIVPLAWTGGLYPIWLVAGLLTDARMPGPSSRHRAAPYTDLTLPEAVAAERQATAEHPVDRHADDRLPTGDFAAGQATARATSVRRCGVFVLGAVGWDLFLDPQMVADGQWTWRVTDAGLPGLPQIPYTNYLGWALVATLMAVLLTVLDRRLPPARDHSVAVPVAVFAWTWLGSTLAHAVFLGLPASAAWGFAGLGLLGIPLLARHARAG
ncbi:carotenoid biosynthesis protein [Nocardia asteroides]|uniref:carotenoid biosynthesis protein n=1 Tax=Nocardia asteroides TaxID=1824 RepID=UPI001E29B968|nr:carotenoid biosynthesis protein [Nocardia asteroides]UGT54528.1 carotenoid biosynthesis protein [Nocardia asteroides]